MSIVRAAKYQSAVGVQLARTGKAENLGTIGVGLRDVLCAITTEAASDNRQTNMNGGDQIQEIAKMDGKKYHKPTDKEWESGSYYQFEPNYLYSYDAIVPVIMRQIKGGGVSQLDFVVKLNTILPDNEFACYPLTVFASPSQLCEALLKAAKKWKE